MAVSSYPPQYQNTVGSNPAKVWDIISEYHDNAHAYFNLTGIFVIWRNSWPNDVWTYGVTRTT
jgi:hypothetical protein